MTSLYPDESYCTSEIGRLLFHPKNEWSVTGKVVDVIEVRHIAGNHIGYKIEISCVPRNNIERDDRVFTLTSRFRELNRLHSSLSKLHKQLYLRGNFPQFALPRLLGNCEPHVITERRRSIDEFLAFVLDNEVLRKARVMQEWVEKAVEQAVLGQPATPHSLIYEGVNIMDAPNIPEQDDDSPQVLVPEPFPSRDVGSTGPHTATLHDVASDSDFQFPDVVISELYIGELLTLLDNSDPVVNVSLPSRRMSAVMEQLFPKLPPTNTHLPQVIPSLEDANYLVRGAHLVSTAQRAEQEHAYELAFQCYKSAASSLIQGIQCELDVSRRNAIRRKTAKYLLAAERLYHTHLAYDGAVNATADLKSLVESVLTDPDILAFQCANNCLKNYRVDGVLPSINAHKWVLKVEEKSSGRFFVMKLLEKGVPTSKSRALLPTNVPHMVQLYQFFETDVYIILVLEYVESGTLWEFLARYFNESEKRFLLGLAAGDKSVVDDEVGSSRTDFLRSGSESNDFYRGRRLLFSVGVDFERVAEMRDETQSSDVPSTSVIVCTMGEDVTGASTAPEGDFYLVGDEATNNVEVIKEESPTQVQLPGRQNDVFLNESHSQTLSASISCVRTYLRRERRRAWPERRLLPEPLIVHWMAQLVSWLYVMHNEHEEAIGDLRPDNLLIDMDGNLLMTYYCKWHNTDRPKQITAVYSAPECFNYGWIPCVENDLWTLGAIMFELLSGRALVNAAPHGVTSCNELPFPDDVVVSFSARDLVSQLLTDFELRPSLESVRAHAFFRTIDWSRYDNPHASTSYGESTSLTSYSASAIFANGDSGDNGTGLPPYVPDLLDVVVDGECG